MNGNTKARTILMAPVIFEPRSASTILRVSPDALWFRFRC